jgi:ketosteroid isomerase-like protein
VNRRTVVAVLAIGALVAAYLYWASDERQIRRLLDGVAGAVTQEEDAGGVAGLAEVAGLNRYLAPDVVFEPGAPFSPITGAQDIVSTVGRLRAVMRSVELIFSDVQVAVDGDAASVSAAARLTLRDRDGAETVEMRHALIALAKGETGWTIMVARTE